jgi:DNA-directed RNA polymerase subunit alpha
MNMIARNWRGLIRPRAIQLDASTLTPFYGRFTCEPLERGYGITIGNALRRTLLSSLAGAAITWVRLAKVDGNQDLTELLLDLKEIVFRASPAKGHRARLDKTGPAVIHAGDLELEPGLEVMNPDRHLATLAEGATLALELGVEVGRGYVPAHLLEPAPGAIPLDAAFSPVRKATYAVTSARVGQQVDYDRLTLEVWTNGSVEPPAAAGFAAKVLREQLSVFIDFEELDEPPEPVDTGAERPNEHLFRSVEELELSVRAMNCLHTARIERIGDLVQRTDRDLMGTRNFGVKSLREIETLLRQLGLSLGMTLDDWPAMLQSWEARDSE